MRRVRRMRHVLQCRAVSTAVRQGAGARLKIVPKGYTTRPPPSVSGRLACAGSHACGMCAVACWSVRFISIVMMVQHRVPCGHGCASGAVRLSGDGEADGQQDDAAARGGRREAGGGERVGASSSCGSSAASVSIRLPGSVALMSSTAPQVTGRGSCAGACVTDAEPVQHTRLPVPASALSVTSRGPPAMRSRARPDRRSAAGTGSNRSVPVNDGAWSSTVAARRW